MAVARLFLLFMTTLTLPMGRLYLMSGLPASGKSTLLKNLNLPDGFVVSSDQLRKQLYGTKLYLEQGIEREHLYGWNRPGPAVFDIMKTLVRERMREGLTTFVDATLLTDSERDEFIRIATAQGVSSEVLIFDVPLEEVIRRDEARVPKVAEGVIRRMATAFQKTSQFAHRMVTPEVQRLELKAEVLPGDAYDVVGDVHGLLDEFLPLLTRLGYRHDENGVPIHPQGRKLLFLGDVVDRGRQSILLLHYVEQAVSRGGHVFVPGNHEDKLLKTWEGWVRTREAKGRSRSSSETFLDLIAQPDSVQERLMHFIRTQPAYRLVETRGQALVFAHADIVHFDPLTTPRSGLFYGDSDFGKVDSDASYEANFQRGVNRYALFRGHIEQISSQPHVHSIEFDQAFGGDLAVLRLDDYVRGVAQGLHHEIAFAQSIHKERVAFHYGHYQKLHFALAESYANYEKMGVLRSMTQKEYGMKMFDFNDIQKLIDTKRVKKVETDGMALYKYGKSVFYDNLWSEHPFLGKARGLVLDMAGAIVQHPFDKIFNYGENGTALHLTDDTPCEAIEKLNGFLGCITKHPYKEGELLVTTTGSFDSDFVGYVRDFLDNDTHARLLTYFEEQDRAGRSKTLMFEVIHPKDNEHPVQYMPEQQGLWLIGARGKQADDPLESEAYLDLIGAELNLKRPQRFETTFGQVRQWANDHSGEGYMVRIDDVPVVKFKTTEYLAVKFVGRLSDNNTAFMYRNPEAFKLKVDEEYVPMVDALMKRCPTPEDYKAIPRSERMDLVRELVKEMRHDQEAEVHLAGPDGP